MKANEANKLLLEVKKLVAQGKLKARVLDGAAYLTELAGTVTIRAEREVKHEST